MIFFKRLYWETVLRPDWYFVALDGGAMLRPAYWNGVVWENRIEILHDRRIGYVLGRVPNPHNAGALCA